MTALESQVGRRALSKCRLSAERVCALAGVSWAGHYRQWRNSLARQEDTGLPDAVRRVALVHLPAPFLIDRPPARR